MAFKKIPLVLMSQRYKSWKWDIFLFLSSPSLNKKYMELHPAIAEEAIKKNIHEIFSFAIFFVENDKSHFIH